MTSKINAITTGAGGIEVTGDSSGEIEFQADGSTIATITASGLSLTGTLPIADGGTGQTTATSAFNALAPSQTSNSGKYLTTDGTNTSWATIASSQWTTSGSNIYYTTGKVSIGTTLSYSTVSLFEGSVNQNHTGSQTLPNSTVTILNGNSRADLSFVSKREDSAQTQNVARIEAEGSGGWNSKLHFYTANNWGDSSNHAMSIYGTNLQFNSGYGSVATAYGCRAWVNFNGTGTIAIRDDGNVSSITDNGTGDYTVSFTTALPDTNYCVTGHANHNTTAVNSRMFLQSMTSLRTTSSIRVRTRGDGGTAVDSEVVDIAIIR